MRFWWTTPPEVFNIFYYNTSTQMGTGPISGGLIASGQAFWTVATAGGQSVSFTENSKTTSNGTFRRDSEILQNVLTINLNQDNLTDIALIGTREGATSDFDELFDTKKQPNGIFNVSSLADDGTNNAINVFDQLQNGQQISLDIFNISPGTYTFTMEETFDESIRLVLVDNFLEEEYPIEPAGEDIFSYTFEVTTDAMTFGAGRFTIQVGESVITDLDDEFENLTLYPNPVTDGELLKLRVTSLFKNTETVDIDIIDRNGATLTKQILSVGVNGTVEINMDSYASGVYLLRVIGNKNVHHFKVIKN